MANVITESQLQGQCNPFQREVGNQRKRLGRGYPAGLEDGREWNQEPRNSDILKSLEKVGKQNFP